MGLDYVSMLAFVCCPLAFFLAVYLYLKYQRLQKDFSTHLSKEAAVIANDKTREEARRQLENELTKRNHELKSLERDLAAEVTKRTDALNELELKKTEFTNEARRLENSVEHYKEQTQSLVEQLKTLDSERQEFRKQVVQSVADKERELEKKRRELELDQKTWKQDLEKSHRADLNALSVSSKNQNAQSLKEMESLKKRLKQHHYFYKSYHGQKLMLEERIENWETALKAISLGVLKEKLGPQEPIPEKFAPLVAKAMDLLQVGPLVNDDEPEKIHMPTTPDSFAVVTQ